MSSPDHTTPDLPAALAKIINHALETDSAAPRFGDRKVYIGPLLDEAAIQLGTRSEALRLALVEANRRHLLTLARADHVVAMDPELVDASHIHHLGSDFHFVVDPGAHFYHPPHTPPTATRAPEPGVPNARHWASHHRDGRTGTVTLLATAEILPERDQHDLVSTVVTVQEGLQRGQTQTYQDLSVEDACERLWDRLGFKPAEAGPPPAAGALETPHPNRSRTRRPSSAGLPPGPPQCAPTHEPERG